MSYKSLSTQTLNTGVTYHRPALPVREKTTLDSPAFQVMTDLKQIMASTIHAKESIEDANNKMKARGVRMLLVVDMIDEIQGLVTSTDILGEKPLQFIQKYGGHRDDIKVKDIMTRQSQINVISIQDVSHAKVGDIVETLKSAGHQHAVVVDKQGWKNAMTVRGIISLNQIARLLGIEIQKYDMPQTLAEIANYKKRTSQ